MLRRRLSHFVLLALSLSFVILTFVPIIRATSWHLLHHGQVLYEGTRFHVPLGWLARISPTAVHFEKSPLTAFSLARTPFVAWGAAAPITRPPRSDWELEQDYKNFAALYSTKLAATDEIEEEPVRVGTGDRASFCKQSVLKGRPDWYRTTCLIWRATWRASFEGGPKEKEQFFVEVLGLPDPRPVRSGKSAVP